MADNPKDHLTDEQIEKIVAGESILSWLAHLQYCAHCRNRVSAVKYEQAEAPERREASKDKLRDVLEEDLDD